MVGSNPDRAAGGKDAEVTMPRLGALLALGCRGRQDGFRGLGDEVRRHDLDAGAGTLETLQLIVLVIRERFAEAGIILWAGSGFAHDAILSWCEQQEVFYVVGLAKNSVVLCHLGKTMFPAKADACTRGGRCTCSASAFTIPALIGSGSRQDGAAVAISRTRSGRS